MFKIQMPDGKFSLGGDVKIHFSVPSYEIRSLDPIRRNSTGKTWNGVGQLKNHLLQYFNPERFIKWEQKDIDKMIALYDGADVVEYELIERKRTPLKVWWEEHNKR